MMGTDDVVFGAGRTAGLVWLTPDPTTAGMKGT